MATEPTRFCADLSTDEDRLEVLAGAATGASVHVPLEALVEPKPSELEDLRVELAAIVDDDAHRRASPQRRLRTREDCRDPGRVFRERRLARPPRGGA